ncbi:glutamate-1-semialdehyde 2,1-aminomutase [Roseiflexus sp.]|uniref:glutamate-1-semialdehyde 2,1-aminomutase n=1 Tax=Roseiflexus sp. TaxID=2562120 RepID=UPI0021DBC6C6|nr:glutamate-1-semialdehyde 2,1-aminomutase [Roseiflexus sp.]GIW01033.1 MAG: glutamate-1-semialdehyde 2,1-aminomutase [Roseiflexus sp.]
MKTYRSESLFAEARSLFPGGVNSPVRAFRAVGGAPRFIARGEGAFLVDVDGNRYIDYVLSWGPLILGHAHPNVVAAIAEQAAHGTSFGAPTELESELARLITQAMPSVEMVRFVSSGTEAAMSTLRLARAATRRDKVIKFAGCYHGHFDGFLVQAGSGVATLGLPDSPGVTAATAASTLTAPYNDLDAVESLLKANPGEVAAIAVEPVAGNMGLVLPQPGFLEGLRRLADEHGALLIFDEVMTGFRVGYGGAQGKYGITPDLTCLGKVIGGGLPAAAYGGRRDLMELIAPAGPVYQAGTLSGNPLAMAAGAATLRAIRAPGVFEQLERAAAMLCSGFEHAAAEADIALRTAYAGSMWGFFFTDEPVVDYVSAKKSDTQRYAQFFHAMLERGIYLAPAQFEASFVSLAHSDALIQETIAAAADALRSIQNAARKG